MDKLKKIGIVLLAIGGISTPLVPSQLELQYSYQYPASDYQSEILDLEKNILVQNPQKEFEDDDKNGLISVSVFTDDAGNKVFQQIPDSQYSDMGKTDGYLKNPKKSELKSILELLTPKAEAAIALDTSVNGGLANPATSLTYAHTVTGTNPIIFVGAFGAIGSDNITGVTYAGVSMSLVDKEQISGDRWLYLFLLTAPSTGANNVVISANASIAIGGQSASYTGVKQTGQPDAFTKNTGTSVTSLTTTLTTIADNSWTFMVLKTIGNGPIAGSGTVRRQTANNMAIFDSNGAITPAGSASLIATFGSDNVASVMASFAPFVAASATDLNNIVIFE